MRLAPHFALRGLHRRAGAAIGLAARLDDGNAVPRILLADLAHHPLVAPVALEKLAVGVDAATPLQRALARIAQQRPERAHRRRMPVQRTDLRGDSREAHGASATREEAPAGLEPGRRVAEILKAASRQAGSLQTPEQREQPTQVHIGREAESLAAALQRRELAETEPAPVRASVVTPAAARATFDRWIESAGAGSDRAVGAASHADVVGALIAGRKVLTAALIGAAGPSDASAEPDGQAPSLLAESASRLAAALDRIETRRLSLRERRSADMQREVAAIDSEPAASFDGPLLDDAGGRVSGLRRLAMRTSAGIRSVATEPNAEPAPWARRAPSDAPGISIKSPEPDDDTLARRIADILTREARRHGVETGGIEP